MQAVAASVMAREAFFSIGPVDGEKFDDQDPGYEVVMPEARRFLRKTDSTRRSSKASRRAAIRN